MKMPKSRGLRHLVGRTRLFAVLGLIGVCALAVSVPGTSASPNRDSQEPFKIAVTHSAPFADNGYGSQFLGAIRTAMKRVGGDYAPLVTVENLPYDAQMTATVEQLFSQQDIDLLIDASAGGELVFAACAKFPDKHCLENNVGGGPPNTATMLWDTQLFKYVQGVAAGMLTKSGTIGFVNSVKGPGQISMLNSVALGCQSVLPTCKVRNIYTNSFFDPPKETEATNTLVNAGADVIVHSTNDPAVLTAAVDNDVWSYGNFFNQRALAPKNYINSFVTQPATTKAVEIVLRAIKAGKPLPKSTIFGTAKPIDIPMGKLRPKDLPGGNNPWGRNVPQDVKDAAEKAYKSMQAGKTPYVGPIFDSKGKLRIKKGSSIGLRSDFLLRKWTWPVKGVIGG